MLNQITSNQTCIAAASNMQCGAASTLSVDDAVRQIQAMVMGAAAAAYPSEWLFASVGGN